jgi:hypothetical protein
MSLPNPNKGSASCTEPAGALRPEVVAGSVIDAAPNLSAADERRRTRVRLMARTQDGHRESCRKLLDDIGPMLMKFLRRRIVNP